jgi:hypothetical protein
MFFLTPRESILSSSKPIIKLNLEQNQCQGNKLKKKSDRKRKPKGQEREGGGEGGREEFC